MSDYKLITGRRKQLEERIAELDTENKRLKNCGTITSPMDGLFEENERLEAKLDAVRNVKTFGMESSGSSDGTYRVVQWAKWDDVLEALGEAK